MRYGEGPAPTQSESLDYRVLEKLKGIKGSVSVYCARDRVSEFSSMIRNCARKRGQAVRGAPGTDKLLPAHGSCGSHGWGLDWVNCRALRSADLMIDISKSLRGIRVRVTVECDTSLRSTLCHTIDARNRNHNPARNRSMNEARMGFQHLPMVGISA